MRITAIDLDNNNRTINELVETRTIQFNKKRISRAVKEAKQLRKIENPENPELTPIEIDEIKLSIIHDEETLKFREQEIVNLSVEKENYLSIRKDIDGLNDMWFDSIIIEKADIQKYRDFHNYNDLVIKSMSVNQIFHNVHKDRLASIEKDINSSGQQYMNGNPEDLMMRTLDNLFKLRDMYQVDTTVDDFEIFDKYGLETNIDVAQELSQIYFAKYRLGIKSDNIINDLIPKSKINKLVTVNNLLKNKIVSNKFLGTLLSKEFISNNETTVFENMWGTETNQQNVYRTRTLGELLFEITNTEVSLEEKKNRQQIYMTYDGIRPGKNDYNKWNGLQVYDIDLKLWIKKSGGDIMKLKELLHQYLSDFHWYLWICTSASGKGLHIYTKVAPPHHVYSKIKDNEYISKYWHQVNYITKLSNIYDILYRLHMINGNGINFSEFWKERQGVEIMEENDLQANKYVDNIVSRITAGIRLAYDEHPLVNPKFVDMHCGWVLGQTLDGFEYLDTVEKVILRHSKLRDRLEENLVVKEPGEKSVSTEIDLSKFVSLGGDISKISALPKSNINYVTRYNVCNTLAALFGKDGLQIAHKVLDTQGCRNVEEINGFYSCAISNGKEPTKLGLEILKKTGIIKSVEPELEEAVNEGYKLQLKKQIERSIDSFNDKITFNLTRDEYLSDKQDELLEMITGERINIIFSPPGTGKTHFILNLAKQGKRVMLVLPYISVIKNKVENDKEILREFDTFYGNADIKTIQHGRNVVTTFDKFSRSNYEKISRMFDYIFIDESHLLFTSSYRIEATSNSIKKIKELFFISSNDPLAGKLVLMTGTETGETYFFRENVANVIRVAKPYLDKQFEILICGDTLDALTQLAASSAELLNKGYKLMIPTNKGEIYSEKIIGMIEYLLQRPVKYGYYKRSNTEQEICRLINEQNTVGDYDIVFCSNYLSVGVDINDKKNFASLYFGNFSGYEIEQFNARIRRTGIKSIYCLHTNTNDGVTNSTLLNEPNLVLKITDEDKLHFLDDRSIADAKTEFIATFDPVLHKITTPGFSLFNGKIQFNLEEYELISFENKYNVCMEHPIKVVRELSKYGYNIGVSADMQGMSKSEQEKLKQMGIEAARQEKIRKHNLLVGTYVDLVKNNNYINEHGLEFTNVIEWIGKHGDKVIEDRELMDSNGVPCYVKVVFDVFASPQEVIVRSREALDKMYRPARYLMSRYSMTRALEIIYKYVDEHGILKQKNFSRAINLLKLIDSSDANELSEPINKMIEKIYNFVDKFEVSKDYKIGYDTYQAIIDSWVSEYIDLLGVKINTKYGWDKIREGIVEMINDIADKKNSKNGIRFTYNKLPDQDSSDVLNRRSIDSIVTSMFNITESVVINKKARSKHIHLEEQEF